MAEVLPDTVIRAGQLSGPAAGGGARPAWMPATARAAPGKPARQDGPGTPPASASAAYRDWIGQLVEANDAGDLAWYKGQTGEAVAHFLRGLRIVLQSSNGNLDRPQTRFWQATLLRNLAITDMHRGDVAQSLERLDSAAGLAEAVDGSDGWYARCDVAVCRAEALRWRGAFDAAEACLSALPAPPDEGTHAYGRIRLGLQRAAILRNRGAFEAARAGLDELEFAIEVLDTAVRGVPPSAHWPEGARVVPIARMLVHHDMATVAVDRLLLDDTAGRAEAVRVAKEALSHARTAHEAAGGAGGGEGYRLYRLRTEKLLLWLTLEAGEGAFAVARARGLLEETEQLGDVKGICLSRVLLGCALCRTGNAEAGRAALQAAFEKSRASGYAKGQRLAVVQALTWGQLDSAGTVTWRARLGALPVTRRSPPAIPPSAVLTDPVWVAFDAAGAVIAWREDIDELREFIGHETEASLGRRNREAVEAVDAA